MKNCKKCNINKDLTEFGKHKRSKDGKDYYCRDCKRGMNRTWQLNNPDKLKEGKKKSDLQWYENNKNRKLQTNKQWKENNKEYNREWFRKYKLEREQSDPQFKVQNKIRTRLWYALKNKQKNGSGIKDLGCSVEDLMKHLENQFTEGMSWDNYGEWHIDHIKPLSKFDLENREEFLKACNYKNLQPLWARDNISKSNTTF